MKTLNLSFLVLALVLPINGCTAISEPSSAQASVLTIDEANLAVSDHLNSLATTADAKMVLADFYDNFYHGEVYIWQNSDLVEVNNDEDCSGVNFDYYEVARFPMPSNPEGGSFVLPEIFTDNMTEALELIHPAQDRSEAYSERTIAVRWAIDAHTGQVIPENANALRLEALLIGDTG